MAIFVIEWYYIGTLHSTTFQLDSFNKTEIELWHEAVDYAYTWCEQRNYVFETLECLVM